MMPNMDPRALKRMMDSMGMKNTEVPASRVVIEGTDKDIIIENPNVVLIEVQGTKSFQVSGEVTEKDKTSAEASEEDISLIRERTGITDVEKIKKAFQESNGDLAAAILALENSK